MPKAVDSKRVSRKIFGGAGGVLGIDRAGPKIDFDNPASPKQGISSNAHAFTDLHSQKDPVRNLRSSKLVLRDASQFCESGVPEVLSRPRPRANSTSSMSAMLL